MRFWELDFLRGTAVLFMVIFHFLWDLNYLGFSNFNLYSGLLGVFQKSIIALFLITCGIVSYIGFAKNEKNYTRSALKRGLLVFSAGILITIFTSVFFPKQIIFFGILHLIGVCILLSIFFADKKNINMILGIGLILLPFLFDISTLQISVLWWAGFAPAAAALDYSPLIPWFGVLLGIFFAGIFYKNAKRQFELSENKIFGLDVINFLGKNSLVIYFIHQPILFFLFYALTFAGF